MSVEDAERDTRPRPSKRDAVGSLREGRLTRLAVSGGVRLASTVTTVVPWPCWHLLASLIGAGGMCLGWRRIVLANVRHVRAENPPRRLVAWYLGMQAIASHCKTVISILRARSGSEARSDRFKIVGLENLEPHLGHRGVVVVAPHIGPYPTLALMTGEWLREQGFGGEVAAVFRLFRPLGSGALMRWFMQRFASSGVTVVEAEESPQRMARKLLTILRRRGIVILSIDEPGPWPSLPVPFFDGRISMPIGPVRLARATKSVILPCAATYGPSRTATLTIRPAIEPSDSVEETLTQVARATEGLIREHLDQWSMLTPIWLSEPASEETRRRSAADLHLHTIGSDGLWDVADWVETMHPAGVRLVAVTDHDHIGTVLEYRRAGGGDCRVLPGVEITARGRIVHVGVLFPNDLPASLPKPGTSLPEVVRWARGIPGSIVVLVHPLPLLWRLQLRRLARARLLPDAIETRFPLVGWRTPALEQAARRYGLATFGGSDAHLSPGQLGRHVTLFPGDSVEDLIAAIHERQTRAETRHARLGRIPPRVYLLQCAYSWLLPFQRWPGVDAARSHLLAAARRIADIDLGDPPAAIETEASEAANSEPGAIAGP